MKEISLWSKIERAWLIGVPVLFILVIVLEMTWSFLTDESQLLIFNIIMAIFGVIASLVILVLPAWVVLRSFYVFFFTDRRSIWRRCNGKVAKNLSYFLIPVLSIVIFLNWVMTVAVNSISGDDSTEVFVLTVLFFLWIWYLAMRTCITIIKQSERAIVNKKRTT